MNVYLLLNYARATYWTVYCFNLNLPRIKNHRPTAISISSPFQEGGNLNDIITKKPHKLLINFFFVFVI